MAEQKREQIPTTDGTVFGSPEHAAGCARAWRGRVNALRVEVERAAALQADVQSIRDAWAAKPPVHHTGKFDVLMDEVEAHALAHFEATCGHGSIYTSPMHAAEAEVVIIGGITFLLALEGYEDVPDTVPPVVREILTRRGVLPAAVEGGAQ
jgi:hypothetical protein